jgi:hypothetical protein
LCAVGLTLLALSAPALAETKLDLRQDPLACQIARADDGAIILRSRLPMMVGMELVLVANGAPVGRVRVSAIENGTASAGLVSGQMPDAAFAVMAAPLPFPVTAANGQVVGVAGSAVLNPGDVLTIARATRIGESPRRGESQGRLIATGRFLGHMPRRVQVTQLAEGESVRVGDLCYLGELPGAEALPAVTDATSEARGMGPAPAAATPAKPETPPAAQEAPSAVAAPSVAAAPAVEQAPTATVEAPAAPVAALPRVTPPVSEPPTVTGLSGLIRVPTADVLPDGQARFSHTTNPDHNGGRDPISPSVGGTAQDSVTIGVLPNLEISFALSADGFGARSRDLSAHMKYRLLDGNARHPSIAVGAADMGRNDADATYFAVASQRLFRDSLQLTLGGATGGNSGLLAGASYRPVDWAELQAEYDTNRLNTGLAVQPLRDLWLRVADVDVGTIYSASYAFPLTYPSRARVRTEDVGPSVATLQEALAALQRELVALGLEDVRAEVVQTALGERLVVAYEDRVHTLNAMDGVSAVLLRAARQAPGSVGEIELRLRHLGLTVCGVRTNADTYREYMRGAIPAAEYAAQLVVETLPSASERPTGPVVATTEALGKLYGHSDLEIGLGVKSYVGTELTRLSLGWWLKPEWVMPIGRGLQSAVRLQIPLAGPLAGDDPNGTTTDRALLSYAFQPTDQWISQVTAGRFALDLDGVAVEVARPLGDAGMLRGTWATLHDTTASAGQYYVGEYSHWLPRSDVQLRFLAGRFLDGDDGWGVDFGRYFGEVNVGIGYRDTDYGSRAELRLSLPLSPRRQPSKPTGLRLRPADTLDYQVRSMLGSGPNYVSTALVTGNELSIGQDLTTSYLMRNRVLRDYVESSLLR